MEAEPEPKKTTKEKTSEELEQEIIDIYIKMLIN